MWSCMFACRLGAHASAHLTRVLPDDAMLRLTDSILPFQALSGHQELAAIPRWCGAPPHWNVALLCEGRTFRTPADIRAQAHAGTHACRGPLLAIGSTSAVPVGASARLPYIRWACSSKPTRVHVFCSLVRACGQLHGCSDSKDKAV